MVSSQERTHMARSGAARDETNRIRVLLHQVVYARAGVSEINYFQRAVAHQGNDFHCLADGNVVSDFGEHRPSRDELALEKLEVLDKSLMMPIALVHQRDQWAGVNENSSPCHVASPSGICCDVRQGQLDPQNILRVYVRMPLQRTNR